MAASPSPLDSVDALLVEAEDDTVRNAHELLSLGSMRRRLQDRIRKLMAEHSIPRSPLPSSFEALACMYDEMAEVFERGDANLQRAWLASDKARNWLQGLDD